jgi:voltage-gated potassium channel
VRLPSNLRAGLIALVVVVGVGATGFVVIGDFDPGEALYVTVITITTVGYSEIGGPFDGGTRLWVVIVLLSGMGAAIYTATSVVEFGLETVVGSDHRKRRKMTKEISNMRDHVIVCGFGRVGSTAWHALKRDNVDAVVIEADALTSESAVAAGALVVEGDATRDQVLKEAGVAHASGVIAAVASASDNLVITLSVRSLRPTLPVAARAVDHETEAKLTLAGATSVVTPELVGGERLAALVADPDLAGFLDAVVYNPAIEFRIKRYVVDESSSVVGRTLADLSLLGDSGAMVVGIASGKESVRINPSPNQPFAAGDIVYGLGTMDHLTNLGMILTAE